MSLSSFYKLSDADKIKKCSVYLKVLHTAYKKGNPLAPLQANYICNQYRLAPPGWLVKEFLHLYSRSLNFELSKYPSHGIASLGTRKAIFKKFVRAEAYFAARAWQEDPSKFDGLPRKAISEWFAGKIKWQNFRDKRQPESASLKVASIGLSETPFRAKNETIRKARNNHPKLQVELGLLESQIALGLRGPNGIFGLLEPTPSLPSNIKKIIREFRAEAHGKFHK